MRDGGAVHWHQSWNRHSRGPHGASHPHPPRNTLRKRGGGSGPGEVPHQGALNKVMGTDLTGKTARADLEVRFSRICCAWRGLLTACVGDKSWCRPRGKHFGSVCRLQLWSKAEAGTPSRGPMQGLAGVVATLYCELGVLLSRINRCV